MARRSGARSELTDVRAFIDGLYSTDLHAKRIASLADATLGVMQAACKRRGATTSVVMSGSLGRDGFVWRLPVPRQQRVQLVAPGPTGEDALQHVGEPGPGFDAVEPGGLDQRCDDCPMLSTAVGPGEQGVFSTESYRGAILPISTER
jgi:hypothetical protein